MAAQRRDGKLFIHAFREIRSYIISENLKPGDMLPSEKQLAERLGVSRNVLREAIKSMELMGMVSAVPGHGTELEAFSLDFVFQNVLFFHMDGDDTTARQMFGIRKALELSYMRQAFEAIGREEIRQLRALVGQIRSRWEAGQDFGEEDRRFHETLFGCLHNQVLTSLLEAIWAVDIGFQLEAKLPHLASSVAKHEAIVDALEAYDYMAFSKAMQNHFSSGKYTTQTSFEEY